MSAVKRRYPKEEIARRGDEIYERAVKPTLKPEDQGKFAAIDIETSDFEIDADEWTAGKKLRARLPQSQIWMVRIGSPFVHRLGKPGALDDRGPNPRLRGANPRKAPRPHRA